MCQIKSWLSQFNLAVEIKQKQFSNQLSITEINNKLANIQENLDKMIEELYGIV